MQTCVKAHYCIDTLMCLGTLWRSGNGLVRHENQSKYRRLWSECLVTNSGTLFEFYLFVSIPNFNERVKERISLMAAESNCRIEPISNLNFEAHVLRSPQPVLLLCMNNQEMLPEQIDILQQHIENNCNSDIRVCVLEEDFIYAFTQMYSIAGLPIFLLFDKGKEIGRMLGIAGPGHLRAFLARYFPETGDNSGEEFAWG